MRKLLSKVHGTVHGKHGASHSASSSTPSIESPHVTKAAPTPSGPAKITNTVNESPEVKAVQSSVTLDISQRDSHAEPSRRQSQEELTEQTHSTAPQPHREEAQDPAAVATLEATNIKWEELWARAYDALAGKEPTVVEEFKQYLRDEFQPNQTEGDILRDPESVRSIIDHLEERRAEKQWHLKFSSSLVKFDVNIREQGEKLLKFAMWSDEMVKTALSSQPHAGLAWCGVTMVLPLIQDLLEQHENMIKGLNDVAKIQIYWKVCEETCLQNSEAERFQNIMNPLITLYSQIVEYQARVVTQLSKPQHSRAWDAYDWVGLLKGISNLDTRLQGLLPRLEHGQIYEKWERQLAEVQKSNEILEAIHLFLLQSEQSHYENNLLEILSSKFAGSLTDIKDRVPGTCEWFFTDEQRFIKWRDAERSAVLWLSAGPGCGKSVLSKSLIVEGRLTTKMSTTNITHFFFKAGDDGRTSKTDAMCALLYRLLKNERTAKLARSAMDLPYVKGNKSLASNFDDLWKVLEHCASSSISGDIICVIDALDECDQADRDSFLRALNTFFSRPEATNGSVKLKFLITCRPYDRFQAENLDRAYRNLSKNTTHFPFPDIGNDINTVISDHITTLGIPLSQEQRDHISTHLQNSNGRTFLWLHLTFKYIEENPSLFERSSDILNQIHLLPEGIFDSYDKLLSRVQDKKRTSCLLLLVHGAARPLTLLEANYALGLAMTNQKFNSHDSIDLWPEKSFESNVKSWSGFLIDVYDGKLSFIHQTAREFLDGSLVEESTQNTQEPSYEEGHSKAPKSWQGFARIHDSHSTLFRICRDYLFLPEFAPGEHKEQTMSRSEFAFLGYSLDYWPLHFESQDPATATPLLSNALSLCNPSLPYASLNPDDDRLLIGFDETVSQETICFFLACSLNVSRLVKHILETSQTVDWNVKNLYGDQTALMSALEQGSEAVIKLLMSDQRIDINATDILGRTALHVALEIKFLEAVEILCQTPGIEVNTSSYDETLLTTAIDTDRLSFVESVLAIPSIDANMTNKYARTPLMCAVQGQNLQIIKALLRAPGIRVNLSPRGGHNSDGPPLIMACKAGNKAVVDILLNEKSIDVNVSDRVGKTPLMRACTKGNTEVIKALLAVPGIDLGATDDDGSTAFKFAAITAIGDPTATRLLCDADGIDSEATLEDGRNIRQVLENFDLFDGDFLSQEFVDWVADIEKQLRRFRAAREQVQI